MSNLEGPVSLLIAIYDNETYATIGVTTLERMEREGAIAFLDSAILVKKGSSASVTVKEKAELAAAQGAFRGAAVGGIIGVIFPPAALTAGALGAATGAALGHFTEQGINNALLEEMGEAIPSGGSAFAAVIEERWEEELSKYTARSGAREIYQFDHEASARLLGLAD